MALPPSNSSEDVFVREVNEELQRDELLGFWNTYGKKLVWGIVGLLLLWAAYLYWQYRQNEAFGLEGEKLTQIVDKIQRGGDTKVEDELKEVLKSDAEGFHAPAGLTLGGVAMQKQDLKKAAVAFGDVAANQNAPQAWRDLALIRQTAAEFDTLKPDVVISRLKPLAVSGKPWFGSAGEMVAVSYVRTGKRDLAGKLLADIAKDEKVPETIRNRSSELANALGVASSAPVLKEGNP